MRRLTICALLALAACNKPIEQEWTIATEGSSKCSPVRIKDTVVFGNESGYLHAFDLNGNPKWSFTAHRDIIGRAVGFKDLVLFGSVNNIFYAVNANTGREVWKFITRDRIKGSPLLVGDRIVFGSYDKRLYALNAENGKLAWQFPAPPPPAPEPVAEPLPAKGAKAEVKDAKLEVAAAPAEPVVPAAPTDVGEFSYARPLLVNDTIYVGNLDGHLYAIDAATGAMKWRFKTGAGVTSGAIHDGGVLYFGSNDHHLYALDLATQQVKWKFETGDEVNASPRLHEGVLYVGGVDQKFYAVEAATGKAKWEFQTHGRIVAAAAFYQNLVFVSAGPGDGRLYALDRATGKPFWTFETQSKIEADPLIDGERMYLVVGDGRLIAFRIKKTS